MSVDLTRLASDEEWLRVDSDEYYDADEAISIQNVLDALNYYRCKAKFAEQELERAEERIVELRDSAEHNRIFGGGTGRDA